MANLNLRSEDYNGSDQVLVGNGAGLQISHIGSSILTPSKTPFVLKQLLIVPEIQKNLISVQQFCSDNLVFFEFHDHFFLIKDYSGKIFHCGTFKDGLYSFSSLSDTLPPHALTIVRASYQIWHNRLGHASFLILQKSISAFTLPVVNKRLPICFDCQLAKNSQLSFKTSNHKSINPLDIVHIDVWGPTPILSTSGARYYVCFLDDCTKFIWLFPIKLKSDVEKVFLLFKTSVERKFNRTIKNIQFDWGGEYRRMSTLLTQIGIHHHRACPYTHQEMGVVEHRHKQIVEVGLSLLSHSKLPQQFWEDAFLTATYIINRLPTPILNQKSPYEIVYRHTPDYHFLKVFGCACWPYLQPYKKHKIDFISKKYIFISYSLDHHGYKCLDLAMGKVYVSRHVIFDEHNFPYKSPDHQPSICPDTPSIIVPFSNIVSSLSLTPAGTCEPSPSPHIDSPLPASSPTPEPAPQSPADSTPASPLILVPHPPDTIPAISNTHPMVTRSKITFPNQEEPLMDTAYTPYPEHYRFLPLPPARNLPHLLKPPNLVTSDLQ
jgi:histone deacetylase 1/2